MSQYIIREIGILVRFCADADPDSVKFIIPKMEDNVFKSVVSARAAFHPKPQLSLRQVNIVGYDDQLFLMIDFIKIDSFPDSLARKIHVRLRLQQNDFAVSDHPFSCQ